MPAHGDEGPTPQPPARVVLLVRPGCHLCDDARTVVRSVTEAAGATWEEVSIEGDADLTARYGELVPVVIVDGTQHAVHRVDPGRLSESLRGSTDGADGAVGGAGAAPAWLRRWRRRPGV